MKGRGGKTMSTFLPLQYYLSYKTLTLSFAKPSSNIFPPKRNLAIPSSLSSKSLLEGTNFKNPITENQRLKRDLLKKLRERDSDPIQILKDDGDWSQQLFWIVVTFLKQSSRSIHILQVFKVWKALDISRSNAFNYENMVGLLAEEGLAENIVWVLIDMKSNKIVPSSKIYNALIQCFIQKGKFDDALSYINEMQEISLKPTREIYHELIKAYANHKMYDEMNKCTNKMDKAGCPPDVITYNLLIQEFSRAGLLKRMERTFQILLMKRMSLRSCTRIAMLEAYANFGMIEEMEIVYRRVMNLRKTVLKDELIRKIASVYIENRMFSRLDELGIDICKKMGRTDMVWCLRILSHACVLSEKGMDCVVREMGSPWSVSVVNIMLLACLKMKDLKRLKHILGEMPARFVKPDIVTIGILFDGRRLGFDVSEDLKRLGVLNEGVEINTDPLVFTAFGKGQFLEACEDTLSNLPKKKKKKVWTYGHLIKEVLENDEHNTFKACG